MKSKYSNFGLKSKPNKTISSKVFDIIYGIQDFIVCSLYGFLELWNNHIKLKHKQMLFFIIACAIVVKYCAPKTFSIVENEFELMVISVMVFQPVAFFISSAVITKDQNSFNFVSGIFAFLAVMFFAFCFLYAILHPIHASHNGYVIVPASINKEIEAVIPLWTVGFMAFVLLSSLLPKFLNSKLYCYFKDNDLLSFKRNIESTTDIAFVVSYVVNIFMFLFFQNTSDSYMLFLFPYIVFSVSYFVIVVLNNPISSYKYRQKIEYFEYDEYGKSVLKMNV